MDIHKNARTTPGMRDLIAGRRQAKETPGRIAGVSGVAEVTLRRWIARHSAEGQAGLVNRSARPHRMQPRPGDDRRTRVEGLRRARQPFRKIAASVGLSCAAVARTGKPCGFGHLSAPDPRPGMTHIDIRKLGRSDGIGHRITGDRTGQSSLGQSNASSRQDSGTGWESLHLAVDDHWHLGCSKMFPGGTRKSCLTFVFPALRFLRNHSVRVWRVLSVQTLCQSIENAWDKAQAHQTLHTWDKRKSRKVRPDILARMGLRRTIRPFRPAPRCP
jgi:hypothetical protein